MFVTLQAKIIAGLVAFVLVMGLAGGAYFYVYHKGQTDERNSNAGSVLQESESSRKLRESNDVITRNLDDERALVCLRNPAGCSK